MSVVEIITQPLGGSTLAEAAIGRRLPADWLEAPPSDAAEWTARATSTRGQTHAHADHLLPAFGETASARLRAALSDGVVVTTGQQPGLFGGPLYTWHKALSALALADSLQEATGMTVAPVFWAATDDTDFLEASSTVIAAPGGAIVVRMPGQPTDGLPMSDVPLGDLSGEIALLARGAGTATHAEYLDIARASYARGATVGSAYVAMLRAILEPLGIAVIDASHAAVRSAADEICRGALRRAERVAESIARRDGDIRAKQFLPQVGEVAGLSLVFHRDGSHGARQRVPVRAASAVADRAEKGSLGPNVLLRPVVERALLPTVAYVAGPGEIAYFAQTSAVADALELTRPMPVPRWSGTIIEPHVRRILDRHSLDVEDLRDPHAAERRVAQAAIPEPLKHALETLRDQVDASTRDLAAAGRSLGVPDAVFEGNRRALAHRLDRLERRLRAAAARRASAAIEDLRTARGALFPEGKRQERALNMIPLLARHGPALLDQLRTVAGEHAQRLVGTSGVRG